MIGGDLHDKNSGINQYQERITKFSSEFELGLFLHIAKQSLIWIFLLLGISLSLAFLYLRYTQPIYQSKTIIQINSNNQANKVLDINKMYEEQDPLAASIEIIKSKVFLNRIVSSLNLYVSYFNEGTFKSSELYISSPVVVDMNIKDPSFYGKNIYLNFETPTSGYIYQKEKKDHSEKIKFTLNNWVNAKGIDFKISYNPSFTAQECYESIQKLTPIYFVKQTENNISSSLQQRLDVRLQNELAKTVSINVRDFNPLKASDIVNSIAAEFQAYDIEKESKSAEKVILFINDQLDNVYTQLKQSEDTLETYRKEKNFNSNERQVQSDMTKISTLEDQLLKTELEEKILENIQQDIQKNKSVDSYQLISSIAGTQDESGIRDIVASLQRLLIEKENLLFQVKPTSEEIKRVNFQIENQKNLLIQSIYSLRQKMKDKYLNLKMKSDEYENKYSSQPKKEIEYARLMRFFSINEKYYTLLLEKKTEFSISKAGFVSQTVVLEKGASNMNPISPNRESILSIAILSSVLIGLIIIIIRYLMHNDINSLNEITKQMSAGVNILGIVPTGR